MREHYGAGHRGACYLVGRKLIESGVRFVTVDTRWPRTPETPGGGNLNWDHHDHIYAQRNVRTARRERRGRGSLRHRPLGDDGERRPGVLRPDRRPATSAACSTRRSSASSPSSAARRRSTSARAATTGRTPTRSSSPAPASAAGRSSAGATTTAATSSTKPTRRKTTPRRSTKSSASTATRRSTRRANRPIFFGHVGEPIRELF